MDHTLAVPGAPAGSTSSAEPPVSRSLLAQVANAAGDLRNPLHRQPDESLLAAVRTAAAPGLWRPSGAGTAPAPTPAAAAVPPTAAAPTVTPPLPTPAAAYSPAPPAPPAMQPPAPTQPSAGALWADVAADLNARSGFNAGGPQQAESGRLLFVVPRGKRSAGPLWDAVAEQLNAEVEARATPEASTAAGGQPAGIWEDVAASVNAEGRAASAGFIIPGQSHSARNAHPRIPTC